MNTKMVFTMKLLAICLLLTVVSYADAYSCVDKRQDCGNVNNVCRMGNWARENCFKYCGFCGRVCGLGWTRYPGDGTCLKELGTYASQRYSWDDAEHVCNSQGNAGMLVVINDQRKTDFIKDLIKDSANSAFWIGLRNTANSGYNFEWAFGGPLKSYRPWGPGQPQNSREIEKCVAMDMDGRWKNYSCGRELAHVCQIAPFRNG